MFGQFVCPSGELVTCGFSGEEIELKRNVCLVIMKPAEGGIYMNIILRHSLEKQLPIDIIYMKKTAPFQNGPL